MIEAIKEFLTEEGFKIVSEKENSIKFDGFFTYPVSIFISDSVICFSQTVETKKRFIAERYEIESFEDFLFVVTKSLRSPLYKFK